MEICYSTEDLRAYLDVHVKADQEHPLLLDRFLENAIEVDVDALGDGEAVHVAGIMQHVEEAGVHSGHTACVNPPLSHGEEVPGARPASVCAGSSTSSTPWRPGCST